jgi:hypothetical protein
MVSVPLARPCVKGSQCFETYRSHFHGLQCQRILLGHFDPWIWSNCLVSKHLELITQWCGTTCQKNKDIIFVKTKHTNKFRVAWFFWIIMSNMVWPLKPYGEPDKSTSFPPQTPPHPGCSWKYNVITFLTSRLIWERKNTADQYIRHKNSWALVKSNG